MAAPLVGIFVGGGSRRMGGRAKGLLAAPDSGEPLVVRLARLSRETWSDCQIVLVGRAEQYDTLGFEALADRPGVEGPLGGLLALLSEAYRRGAPAAYALACDLPFVGSELLARLGREHPEAAAVVPFRSHDEPLCARYEPDQCLAAAERVAASGRRALHAVLDELGVQVARLTLTTASSAELADWDSLDDISSSQRRQ